MRTNGNYYFQCSWVRQSAGMTVVVTMTVYVSEGRSRSWLVLCAVGASRQQQPVAAYSSELLSQLPIRYLLQQAQTQQHLYAGLFAPLLR